MFTQDGASEVRYRSRRRISVMSCSISYGTIMGSERSQVSKSITFSSLYRLHQLVTAILVNDIRLTQANWVAADGNRFPSGHSIGP